MHLPLWIKLRKNKKSPCLSGQQEGKRVGEDVRGVPVGGYMLEVMAYTYDGLG